MQSSVYLLLAFMLVWGACESTADLGEDVEVLPVDTLLTHVEVLEELASRYQQMPEKQVAVSQDGRTYAQFASPTERYRHGALGDVKEAAQLVVYREGTFYTITLGEAYVFEDIRPRLVDVTADGVPEIICIRSKAGAGAGIVVYRINQGNLEEYARVPEIGTANRWLNIAAIHDMDADGTIDLLWVQTPHIGGILKGTSLTPGELQASDSKTFYSNHQGGSINLCLSVLRLLNGEVVCYVPSQQRDFLAGFTFVNGKFTQVDHLTQAVDFTQPLSSQWKGGPLLDTSTQCIY